MQRIPRYYSPGLIMSGRLARRKVTIIVRAGFKRQAMLLWRQAERRARREAVSA